MPVRSLTSFLKRLTISLIVSGQFGVHDVLVIFLMLELVDDGFERLMIFAGALLHAEHDVAIHLDETAITIPSKARDSWWLFPTR